MSVRVSSWAWRFSSSGGTDRLVLLALGDEANDEGLVCAYARSQSHIASKCNVSVPTVKRAIKRLEELGELEVLADGHGRRQADYRIIMRAPERGQPDPSARSPVTPQTGQDDPAARSPVTPPSSRSDPGLLPVSSLAPAARKRDELWDAVLEECGIDSTTVTTSARGAYNRAVKELRDVGATPELVRVRVANYRQHFGEAALTPPALAKHWAKVEHPPERGPRLLRSTARAVQDPATAEALSRTMRRKRGGDADGGSTLGSPDPGGQLRR